MKIHFYIAIVLAITLTNIQFSRGRPDGGCNGGYKDGVCCNDGRCGYFGDIDGYTWSEGRRQLEEPRLKQLHENPCSVDGCHGSIDCVGRCKEYLCKKYPKECTLNRIFDALAVATSPFGWIYWSNYTAGRIFSKKINCKSTISNFWSPYLTCMSNLSSKSTKTEKETGMKLRLQSEAILWSKMLIFKRAFYRLRVLPHLPNSKLLTWELSNRTI